MASRPYHHGDLRRALIEAGMAILQEQGLEALTLRACASRAGVSHAAPKNHFPTLRSLVTAIAAEGFRLHAAAMRDGLDPGASREAAYFASMKGYVRFATEHPALFQLMFTPGLDFTDPTLAIPAFDSYAVLKGIATGLQVIRAEGAQEQEQEKNEMMLWSFVHGYSMLVLSGMFAPVGPTGPKDFPVEQVLPVFPYAPLPDPARPGTKKG